MLTSVAALWEACSVLRWREWWRAIVHATAAALPLMLAAALVTGLQYVDTGGNLASSGSARIRWHSTGWWKSRSSVSVQSSSSRRLPRWRSGRPVTGARGCSWRSGSRASVFYFWVDIRDHQDVYVGWRVGHLWFIASAALGAVAWTHIATLSKRWRVPAIAVVALAVAAALPTTLIDIYNTQDIFNRQSGSGFACTLLLSARRAGRVRLDQGEHRAERGVPVGCLGARRRGVGEHGRLRGATPGRGAAHLDGPAAQVRGRLTSLGVVVRDQQRRRRPRVCGAERHPVSSTSERTRTQAPPRRAASLRRGAGVLRAGVPERRSRRSTG